MQKSKLAGTNVRKKETTLVGPDLIYNACFRPNLPYTECVIQEILRVSCIAPLGLPHYAQKDLTLQGGRIRIPKGTTVMPHLFHIVNNPREFAQPERFNPERFLSPDGKYVKHEHNIIFSIGN